MDFAFGEPQTVSEFLLIAALEILLLSFGILLALRINNWNEGRKESKQTNAGMWKVQHTHYKAS